MQARSFAQRLRRTLASGAIVAGAGLGTAIAYGQLSEAGAPADSPADSTLGTLAAVSGAGGRQATVLVCQATGDGSYVTIRVLPERLDEYRQNPNNIVPAPPGGCPARVGGSTTTPPTTTTTTPSTTQTTPPRTTTSTPTRTTPPPRTTTSTPTRTTPPPRTTTSTPTRTTPPPRTTSTSTQTTPPRTTSTSTQTTAPTQTSTTPSSSTAPSTASGTATAKKRSSSTYTGRLKGKSLTSLPNTGNDDTALLLLGGLALLLAGSGLHLRTRPARW